MQPPLTACRSLRIGVYEATWLSDTPFGSDGGAMFGIVPRALWQKKIMPDERNRVFVGLNCLLLRGAGRTLLVDAGIGNKLSEKQKAIYGLDPDVSLLKALDALGVPPEQVDTVLMTHLHLDHAGWLTVRTESGELVPTFPNARHVVQVKEWEAAHADHPLLSGSYVREDYDLLAARNLLELVDGDAEPAPGVRALFTGAHSPGHQVIKVESGGERLFCPSELLPTTWHLRLAWVMSYDLDPLRVVDLKRAYMAEAADEGWRLFLSHDPASAFGRLSRESEKEYAWLAQS
ncbi:MAG: MBL fold metallo-hydrolase [Kiritimatiellae bacterium]|nr:MBL fold metallo-hydrolase [Kiritimatiellia bacterium]